VLEQGGERGRIHGHLGTDRFLSIELLSRSWNRGFVWVGDPKKIRGRYAVGQLAAYLAKYLTKDVDGLADDDPRRRQDGQHRYHLAEGFQPEVIRARVLTAAKALAGAMELLGEPDVVIAWGERGEDPVFGYWCGWPPSCWWPPWRAE
jgi:hypothetical protein